MFGEGFAWQIRTEACSSDSPDLMRTKMLMTFHRYWCHTFKYSLMWTCKIKSVFCTRNTTWRKQRKLFTAFRKKAWLKRHLTSLDRKMCPSQTRLIWIANWWDSAWGFNPTKWLLIPSLGFSILGYQQNCSLLAVLEQCPIWKNLYVYREQHSFVVCWVSWIKRS